MSRAGRRGRLAGRRGRLASRRRAALTLAAVAALAFVQGAQAQAVGESGVGLRTLAESRLESLLPRLADAHAEWLEAQSELLRETREHAVEGTDTIRVGPLRVMVLAGEGEAARPYFEAAWSRYARMLEGGEPPEALTEQLFAFQNGITIHPWDLPASPTTTQILVRSMSHPSSVDDAVAAAVGKVVAGTVPGPQGRWSGAWVFNEPNFELVYRELVLGAPLRLGCLSCAEARSQVSLRSTTVGRCRSGDLSSCWTAMGATGRTDPSADLREWYTPDQRRVLASTWTRRACAEGSDQAVCDQVLIGERDRVTPLGSLSRGSLVWLALEMGGEGALSRYSAPLDPPIDYRALISRTAGMDADRIMAEWLRRVHAAKPDRAGTDRDARGSALVWILLFGTLATGSTRWRLG